jgi:hypothetical protein
MTFKTRNELLESIYSATINQAGDSVDTIITDIVSFPNYDTNYIYIADNESYRIKGAVDIGSRTFVVATGAQFAMFGASAFLDSITSSSAGDLFAGDQVGQVSYQLGLNAPNGRYFNYTKTSGFSFIFISDCISSNCQNFASLTDLNVFSIDGGLVTNIFTKGFELFGAIDTFEFKNQKINSFNDTLIDFGTCTVRSCKIGNNEYRTAPGNVLYSGLADSGNIAANGVGEIIRNSDFDGFGTVTNINAKDLHWLIQSDTTLVDSYTLGAIGFESNIIATTMNIGQWSDIEGIAVFDSDVSSKMILNGDNGLQGQNIVAITGSAQAVVTVTKSGSTGVYDFQVWIDKDTGTFEPIGSIFTVEIKTTAGTIPIIAPTVVANNFKYKVRARAVGTSDNITVNNLSLIVS